MPPAVDARKIVLNRMRPEEFGQPIYDRANVATTVPTSINLFSVPIGQSATLIRAATAASVAKTRRDTNLEQAGFIATRAHEIKGLALAIIHGDRDGAANAQDRAYIVDGGWLKFTVASKTILELPLIGIPILNDISAVATTVTATTINGLTGPRAPMYKLNPGITLDSGTNFSVELAWDGTITLGTTADIQLFMYGGMRRPT